MKTNGLTYKACWDINDFYLHYWIKGPEMSWRINIIDVKCYIKLTQSHKPVCELLKEESQ